MKDKKLIALILGLTGFGLVETLLNYPAIQKADQYSQYSFIIQIIIGTTLALYFWYLQKDDNRKMQVVLDKQNKLSEEMHTYIEQQRQIQDSIRARSLKDARINFQVIIGLISKIANVVESDKDTSVRAEKLERYLEIVDINGHVETIEQHLVTLTPYIHADLAARIENAINDIRMVSTSWDDDDDDSFGIFMPDMPQSANDWLEFSRKTIDNLTTLVKEMPK